MRTKYDLRNARCWDMNDDQNLQTKADEINSRLDEAASKASGPDVSYGSTPGYVQDNVEEDAQAAAEDEGVTLYRHPDGSHEAVDETKMTPESDSDG
ncbi:hypothetical protein CXR26_06575 [Brevibacterium aurantiacum]|nr:hypothetical protein CXR26_06575 [Brevibacterium aurantiacum]